MDIDKPAGWYTDTENKEHLRYWDGEAWTKFIRSADLNEQLPMETSTKVGIGIIVLVVILAAIACIALGVSSSASENTTSDKTTSSASSYENNTSEKTTSSSSSTSNAAADIDKEMREYTDDEADFTITFPSDWRIVSEEDREDLGYDSDTFAYLYCDDGSNCEYIWGDKFSGYKGKKITDFSKEATSEMYSDAMSVDSVKKKKLDSGTYYVTKGTDEDNNYYVVYDIVKNGYHISFSYASTGGKSETPHLSDFKEMVNNASYK